MTKQELVDKYIQKNGLFFIRGNHDDISVLMPYFIMDVGYQYYCHYVQPLKLTHDIKKARSQWRDAYLSFNRRFTSSYTNDENIEIGELMDEMHDFLANYLMIMQVAAMRLFEREFTFEQQKVLSAAFMTNKLAVVSQRTWRQMYRKDNPFLDGVMQRSMEFSDWYMYNLGHSEYAVEEKKVKELLKCCDIVIDKIAEWLTVQKQKK